LPKKRIGPKGQILIPKPIRDALGLHPGVEVMIEVRGDEVIITKPKIEEAIRSTTSPRAHPS